MSPTTRPRASARARALLLMVVPATIALAACDTDAPAEPQALPSATLDPSQRETGAAPVGDWVLRQSAGFSVATPPEWQVPPEEHRLQGPVLHVEFPFTGQPHPPARLLAFVERGAVGDVATRESILRAMLSSQLLDATSGDTQQVEIDGATGALEFEISYRTESGTSYLGTTLRGAEMRQVELLVETEGSPKLGFRYSAPAEDFDEAEWERIRDSIQVRPQELQESEEGSDAVQGR